MNSASPALVDSSAPTSFAELQEIVRASERVLPVGSRTKAALTASGEQLSSGLTTIDMRRYSGIVSYDPSEFLISARAGTTIAELARALAEHGQYLPFDPVFENQQATLGGSIASGISGPCRLLYGGLRDFMLEVAMCDSQAREIRGGGKVVKNAAGFDLPKLVVGSYGRLGIITEATLKVFPRPTGFTTLHIPHGSLRAALDTCNKLLAMPLPIAALEIQSRFGVAVRLAGPVDSLDGLARRVRSQVINSSSIEQMAHGEPESILWSKHSEFAWSSGCETLVRVATTHHQCRALVDGLSRSAPDAGWQLSCGATVAWIALKSVDQLGAVDGMLQELKLSGIVIRGTDGLTPVGDTRWIASAQRIQQSLDVEHKYLGWHASCASA